MKISLCYIVKDELSELERSLTSAAAIADEIIIGVTFAPSREKVRDLGARFKARVLYVPWQNDFALARNMVLREAVGAWVLFLDADEWFVEAPDKCKLQALLEWAEGKTDALLLPMRNVERTDYNQIIAVMDALRLFKNIPGRYYVGRVHERLQDGERTVAGSLVREQWLTLLHTGYAKELLQAKGKRNLPMLLAELEKSSEPEKLYTYLAEAYEGLGNMAEAMHYARLDIARGRQRVAYACRSYRILLRGLTGKAELLQEKIQIAQAAVRDFPELPELWAELSVCRAADYDFSAAVVAAEKALLLWKKPEATLEPVQFTEAAARQLAGDLVEWRQIVDLIPKMKIAACVIVKNEARDLPVWLEKSSIYADALYVTDTGSTDNTVSVALEAGTRVSHFTWCDDFAAARNYALSQVEQGIDWVVFLDADEYFYRPERVRARLAEICVQSPQVEVMNARVINIDEATGREMSRGVSNERFIRRGCQLAYKGKVHEHVVALDERPAKSIFFGERMPLHHTGYSPGRMQAKAERNLALLLAEQQALPEDERARMEGHLAQTWFSLGHWQECVDSVRKFINSPYRFITGGGEIWHVYLQSLRELQVPAGEFLQAADKAIQALPDMPELYLEKGMALCAQNKLEEAEELLFKAEEVRVQSNRIMADGYLQQAMPVYLRRLGELWLHLRSDRDRAHAYLIASLGQVPYDVKTFALYYECMEQSSLSEIVHELEEIEVSVEWRRFIFRQALHLGAINLAEYYSAEFSCDNSTEASLWQQYQTSRLQGPVSVLQGLAKSMVESLEPALLAALQIGHDLSDGRRLKLYKEAVKKLPPRFKALLELSGGITRSKVEAVADTYLKLLPLAMKQSAAGREHYALLAEKLGDRVRSEALRNLVEMSCWQEALVLLETVEADSPAANAEFWQMTGLVLYHLEQLEMAESAWKKAEVLGADLGRFEFYRNELRRRGIITGEEA